MNLLETLENFIIFIYTSKYYYTYKSTAVLFPHFAPPKIQYLTLVYYTTIQRSHKLLSKL